jgi:hypothetical protein
VWAKFEFFIQETMLIQLDLETNCDASSLLTVFYPELEGIRERASVHCKDGHRRCAVP